MKSKLTLTSIMLAAGAIAASAAQLTPEAALQRALGNEGTPLRRAAVSGMTLAGTEITDETNLPAIYAFNMPGGGFTIVGADDRLPAVLGYTDNGTWEGAMEKSNFRAWINSYSRQIDAFYAAPGNEGVDNNTVIPRERAKIEPLIATRWDQDKPFDGNCPSDAGGTCLTGCVATAMAQIMKYHEWPKGPGTGSSSYTWNNQTLSFNYAATTFDWDNMLNAYGANQYTPEQAAAVSKLMEACGVSVRMNYSSESSGAFATNIQYSLQNYFGYDKGINYVKRDYYSQQEWDDIIYNELAEGRPVIYDGEAFNGGGHCFIADGYSSNNFFHINWGWSGLYDGYYLLSSLEPGTGGHGAGLGVFNLNQDAIIGIQPPVEGSWFHLPIAAYGNCVFTGISPTPDEKGIVFSFGSDNLILNYSPYTYDTDCAGIIMRNGIVEKILESENKLTFEGQSVDGYLKGAGGFFLTMYPEDVPTGESMILVPALKVAGGEWTRVRFQNGATQYVYLDNDGEWLDLSNATPTRLTDVAVQDLKADDIPNPGETFSYSGTITNRDTRGYTGILYLTATDKNGVAHNIGSQEFTLRKGVTSSFSGTTTAALEAGIYSLDMRDELGLIVSQLGTVDVGNTGVGTIADGTARPGAVEVYSIHGVKVGSGASEAEATAGLPSGIYILSDGRKIVR